MQDVALTLEEACAILNPPIPEPQLRAIIRALHWQPCGHRHDGQPGHPRALYPWTDITRLHQALTPWLTPQHATPQP